VDRMDESEIKAEFQRRVNTYIETQRTLAARGQKAEAEANVKEWQAKLHGSSHAVMKKYLLSNGRGSYRGDVPNVRSHLPYFCSALHSSLFTRCFVPRAVRRLSYI
jgi:hypothetical protein